MATSKLINMFLDNLFEVQTHSCYIIEQMFGFRKINYLIFLASFNDINESVNLAIHIFQNSN